MKTSIGKVTLGGGKKMVTALNNYRRSTHDLSFIFRSSMAPGVLVPSMKLLMLPGDTFKIKTRCHTLTHPTVGPLFGSFKQQNDFFFCPIRLYNAMLHNNTLNIGLKMSQVKLPIMQWDATKWPADNPEYIEGTNNTLYKQVNPSALFSYLGIKALLGKSVGNTHQWQCVPVLAYYDIFKNYYANKQEEKFYIINGVTGNNPITTVNSQGYRTIELEQGSVNYSVVDANTSNANPITDETGSSSPARYFGIFIYNPSINPNNISIDVSITVGSKTETYRGTIGQLINQSKIRVANNVTGGTNINNQGNGTYYYFNDIPVNAEGTMTLNSISGGQSDYAAYDLTLIDDLREAILASGRNQFTIDSTNAPFIQDQLTNNSNGIPACASPLVGLCLKTYQSDINVNWINTEWIDGDNGINEVTAIDTSSGSFTIDQLNLASKVYRMLNRIAVSDGSYNAWIQTVFTAGGLNHIETPIYLGSSSMEIEFQEVISNSATTEEPLGTLAGRGIATNKKGGNIRFKAEEPGYIMCITSLTPRVDYYQGTEWDMFLNTLDDIHKPQLDGIGFQDRLWRNINASDTRVNREKSIGKQPAWIEYMTNVNKTFGNFAIEQNEGFMCLNRVYNNINTYTTYVQPHLYNNIFADTDITAQNFWVQIGFDIEARRVMSAKVIPNL